MRPALTNLLLFIILRPVNVDSANTQNPAELQVEQLSINEERATDIFRALGSQSHVVIGVSGQLIGSDQTLISVDARRRTLGSILDEICVKDPRYKWREAKDGNIDVSLGGERLGLDDITVASLRLGTLRSSDLTALISNQPEVKDWKKRSQCNIMQVIVGYSGGDLWDLDMTVNREPLWKLLNDLSVRNGTYFWSAVKISSNPCTVSFNP